MPSPDIADHPRTTRSRSTAPVLAFGAAIVLASALAVAIPQLVDPPGSLPAAEAEPGSPDTSTAAPATTPADYPSDQLGYLDSAARCDDDQELVVFGRTARALVVICVDPTGELEYHGVRLSDQASLRMPAGRTPDGAIVATNNGVTYAVSPEAFLVSEGDAVLYRDSWAEFGQPRFPGGGPTSTGPTDSTPTVSTTTVTVTGSPDTG